MGLDIQEQMKEIKAEIEEKVEEAKKPEAKGEAEEEIETLTISQSKLVNDYSLNFSKKTSLENIP